MDGGALWATVHGVAKSQTRLNDFTFIFHFHALEKEMATHSSGESHGQRSLAGCSPWGPKESDTTEVTFTFTFFQGFPGSSVGKESACNAGDPGLIPGLGRSSGEGMGYPLQYSWASFVAQLVKNPPAMRKTWV